jgi:hypothetical protein
MAKPSTAASAINSTDTFLPAEHPQSHFSSSAAEAVAVTQDSTAIDALAELRKHRRKVVTVLED